MKQKQLSNYRIILSVILFFGGILLVPYLDNFSNNQIVTAAFIYNIVGFLIIFINYNLFSLHISRYRKQKDKLLYLFVGLGLFGLIMLMNFFFLKTSFPVLDDITFNRFFYFVPLIAIIFSFVYAISYSIVYKLLTDRISIHHKEFKVILVSSILFSLILSICTGFAYGTYLQQFVFNFAITLSISYLYNQTGNLVTGTLSLGIALFVYNFVFLFI